MESSYDQISFINTTSTSSYGSASSAALMIILLAGSLLLLKFLHRQSLKLPPGPFAWPIVGSFFEFPRGLVTAEQVAQLSKKYGDIFMLRIGLQTLIVVSSPELAMEVLQTQGVEFGSRARSLVFDILTSHGQDLVFADYGEHHKTVRRVCTPPFFSGKAIQQCRRGWEEEIAMTMSDLKQSEAQEGMILRDRLHLTMYNIVYRMLFGRRFSGVDDPLFLQLMGLNQQMMGRIVRDTRHRYADFFPFLRKLFLKGFIGHCLQANQNRLDFLRETFLKPHQPQNGHKIGVDYVLEANAKGEISETTMLYLVQNMNVAAIDTTLSMMEWGVAELVNGKHIQDKLRNELDHVLGKGVAITEPDIARIPYLQCVVKELLRVHLVVPLLLPHGNVRTAKLAGKYDIPAGSRILVNAGAIARDTRFWDKPALFDPDRFLHSTIELTGNDMRFIPFGSGRRSCPGMAMALVALSLVLGRLVQEFELLPPPGAATLDMTPLPMADAHIIAVKSKVVLKPRDLS